MNRKDSPQTAITGWQKIALVLLGLFLSLVLLEAGLRLGGFILISMQEYGNLQSIKQKGAYRILCLGESTTQGQYPRLLEKVLNRRNTGVRFSVIDKGRTAMSTDILLEDIESNLAEYHPDMVVAMMGINDRGKHMPAEVPTTSEGILRIRSFRVYKLMRLLWLHLLTKAKEVGFCKPAYAQTISVKNETPIPGTEQEETSAENSSAGGSRKKAIQPDFLSANELVALGANDRNQGKIAQAKDLFMKAIEIDPENANAYAELGFLYNEEGEFSRAEDSFKKAIELNPKHSNAYAGLGWLALDQDKFPEAEVFLRKAVDLDPQNGNAYYLLGRVYRFLGELSKSEEFFKKVIEMNPEKDYVYAELGALYRLQSQFSKAEDSLKKAIEHNPGSVSAFFELGVFYRDQGKLSQAEDSFRKAVEMDPENERVLGAIASLYEEMGKPELAQEYFNKVNRLRLADLDTITVNNYRKLKEILDRKGIKLACVQYPMRDAEPLKRIFENNKGVIFVDNERVFKDALKKGSYKEYFEDMFAGDFGHCTQKGNELLAQNIADVILREVFGKK